MITTNRRILARVCKALLARAGVENHWTDHGPSIGSPAATFLTESQQVTLELARTLSTGGVGLHVAELFLRLDDEMMVVVGTLMVGAAYGERGLSDWLSVEDEASRDDSGVSCEKDEPTLQ